MMDELETEEQAEHRVRAAKLRRVLLQAPAVVAEMVGQVLPTGGRTERGESVTTARIPFRGHVMDDANEVFTVLVEAGLDFAHELGEEPHDTVWVARFQYRMRLVDGETYREDNVFGLPDRAVTEPNRAGQLTRDLTTWLLARTDAILDAVGGPQWADDFARLVTTARFRYGIASPTPREVAARPCPRCGAEVVVSFFGEPFGNAEARGEFSRPSNAAERHDPNTVAGRHVLDVIEGVTVQCAACGWAPLNHPAQIARWIDGDRRDRPGPETPSIARRSGDQTTTTPEEATE